MLQSITDDDDDNDDDNDNESTIQTRRFNSDVVIRIDTHFLFFQVEWKFTVFYRLQFMMIVKIRPPPQAAVYHVWKAFLLWHLQASIQRSMKIASTNGHSIPTDFSEVLGLAMINLILIVNFWEINY